MIKIADCFTFYNELKMLKFRIAELSDVVDYFVLVEANKTFNNKPKPLFFQENKHLFNCEKLIHVVVNDMPDGDNPWIREAHQRNGIGKGLKMCDMTRDDLVIIADIDEIPDADLLKQMKKNPIKGPCALEQDFYYYNISCKNSEKWYHSKIMDLQTFEEIGCAEQARFHSNKTLPKGGWHFSYFGGVEFILNKIQNFSHQEFNNEKICNEQNILDSIKNFKDPFFSDNSFSFISPSENPYLPKKYKMITCQNEIDKNSFNGTKEYEWGKKENTIIDAVILTYTKDLNFYGLTQRTIQTMKNRNKSLNFNITVIEGNVNAAEKSYIYPETTTIVIDQKFNYNKFLNIGLQYCKNKYILICNNDLFFLEDSIVNLVDYMEKNKILSACPQEPNWHSKFFTPEQLANESILGYRTMHEIAGWCICTTREVIEKMGQFDEQFDLYYQDDDYAMFLKTNNIEHHLVNSSKVRHECYASLELIDRDIQELSAELKTKFINKWQAHL